MLSFLKRNENASAHASEKIGDNQENCLESIKRFSDSFGGVSEKLKNDEDFIIEFLKIVS